MPPPTPTPAPPSHSDPGARLAAHAPRLRLLLAHLAGRAVRARVDLEDLLQEIYLRAWTDRACLPPDEAALGRFLAGVARHVVVDVARALRAAKRDGGAAPLARTAWSRAGIEPAAPAPGPPTEVGMEEDARRLQGAFERLSPEHQRVLGLRQFEGLSARATAWRMGRSEAAVHSLYRRALDAWGAGGALSPPSRGESRAHPRPEDP